jgi:hypothetical protein
MQQSLEAELMERLDLYDMLRLGDPSPAERCAYRERIGELEAKYDLDPIAPR